MGYVPRSGDWTFVEVMRLVPYRGHMIDKSYDHDITIIFFFGRKFF